MPENHTNAVAFQERNRLGLISDCESCFGLCCVALPFAASADFAEDKDGGTPCRNLQSDFRCGVHQNLRELGFRGCTVYDCFGAGQKVSQVTFGGQDWRQDKGLAKRMFDVFPIMRQLHELLWYLTEALTMQATRPIHDEIRKALEETERLTLLSPDSFLELDVAAHRADVNVLLLQTSQLVRAETHHRQMSRAHAHTGNKKIQAQLNSARGDASTKLPESLTRPAHWSTFGD